MNLWLRIKHVQELQNLNYGLRKKLNYAWKVSQTLNEVLCTRLYNTYFMNMHFFACVWSRFILCKLSLLKIRRFLIKSCAWGKNFIFRQFYCAVDFYQAIVYIFMSLSLSIKKLLSNRSKFDRCATLNENPCYEVTVLPLYKWRNIYLINISDNTN